VLKSRKLQIPLYVDVRIIERLEALAEANGTSVSALVRSIIFQSLWKREQSDDREAFDATLVRESWAGQSALLAPQETARPKTGTWEDDLADDE
jgi:hypothetical protein